MLSINTASLGSASGQDQNWTLSRSSFNYFDDFDRGNKSIIYLGIEMGLETVGGMRGTEKLKNPGYYRSEMIKV